MGRRRAVYLSYAVLVLLSKATGASAGLWTVDIDLDPAPSPEDGPPFSAHASRDRALLPYQIIGIVGGYLGFVLILGSLLLTLGRKLRTQAQKMSSQPTEMSKPTYRNFDPSPVLSPRSQRSWGYIPDRLKSKKSLASSIKSKTSQIGSPGRESVVTFDHHEHGQHKARMDNEMSDIYNQVWEQEAQKAQQSSINEREIPTAQKSPGVVAIYPQQAQMPLSPVSQRSTIRSGPLSPTIEEYPDSPRRTVRESRGMSVGSDGTAGSSQRSGPRKLRKRLADIKIGSRSGSAAQSPKTASPFQRFGREDRRDPEMMTPLSAGFDNDDEPVEPRTAGTMNSSLFPPTTPGTGKSLRFAEHEYAEDVEIDEVRDMPEANPQRHNVQNPYYNPARALTDMASTRPDPTRSQGSATNRQKELPFRHWQDSRSNLRVQTGDNIDGGDIRPQIAIKEPSYRPHKENRHDAPLASAARTPRTPWTPAVPTPRTPFVFRPSTRAETKQKRREEQATHGVITEEDQVAGDEDLWASGY